MSLNTCHFCEGAKDRSPPREYAGTCWKCGGDGRPRKAVLGMWVPDPGSFDTAQTCDICGGAGSGTFSCPFCSAEEEGPPPSGAAWPDFTEAQQPCEVEIEQLGHEIRDLHQRLTKAEDSAEHFQELEDVEERYALKDLWHMKAESARDSANYYRDCINTLRRQLAELTARCDGYTFSGTLPPW